MKLADIATALERQVDENCEVTGIAIDSRKIMPGNLYLALKGERYDGHDFIVDAVSNGAVAVICTRQQPEIAVPQILVADTINALATLACIKREQNSCPAVALTGSNGKTSVKEMIAQILPQPSLSTMGNLNNHIGVPLSLLKLQPEHRYAVFELGASAPREIAHTASMVKPIVTLINNIAPAHIAGFGSIEGVAHAKGEIYAALPPDGIAIVNQDDRFAHFWDNIIGDRQVVRFGLASAADITAREVNMDASGCADFTLVTPLGKAKITLGVPGMHNVQNALAASAATYALGLPLEAIVTGLQSFTGVRGRMTLLHGKGDALVIDDTYNANLNSVIAGLEVLARYNGRRIFVCGDMRELGDMERTHHEQVGMTARRLGIDGVKTCGAASLYVAAAFGAGGEHYSSQTALIDALLPELHKDTVVLIKGSRSSHMEEIVYALTQHGA